MITPELQRIDYDKSPLRQEAAALILRTIAEDDVSILDNPAEIIQENQSGFLNYAIIGDRKLVIAVGSLNYDTDDPVTAQLENIAVAERFRRLGIASKMIGILEKKASTDGFDTVRLKAVSSPEVIRLYEKQGYQPNGQTDRYISMVKDIAS